MQDLKINERKIKINASTFHLEKDIILERDLTYPIGLMVDITEIRTPSNFDGTVDLIYVAKPTGELVIKTEEGRRTYVVDKRRQSQKLRAQIIMSNDTNLDDEEYYQMMMTKLRHYWDLIKIQIEKWEEQGV